MPEKVTVSEDLEIIRIESWGDITAVDLKGSLEAVIKIRQERGLTKVLVDATGDTSLPSTLPVFEFGAELAGGVRGMRFAIVANAKVREDLDFMETVVRNRGGQMKMFESTQDALAWLTE